MLPLIKLSPLEGELLRKLGKGREFVWEGGRVTLGFALLPPCELVLECLLDDYPLHLGMFERQWCDWLDDELAVPSLRLLAEDLRLPLATLTVEPLQKALEALGLSCPTAYKLDRAPADLGQRFWLLRLEHDGRILNLHLLKTPLNWLGSLIDALHPINEMNEGAPVLRAPVSLVAGWSTIERNRLNSMRCGDALVLRRACAIAQAQVFLFMQRPLATLKITPPDTLKIESLMSDFNDWLDVQPASTTNANTPDSDPLVTVVAEVGSIELPLNTLTRLEKGDVLQGLIHQDEFVTLKIGGRPFAYGMLLDIDGQLAVRIERLT